MSTKKTTKKVRRPIDFVARLMVYGLPNFNKREVARLVKWLRSLADQLEKSPKDFNTRWSAKLMK